LPKMDARKTLLRPNDQTSGSLRHKKKKKCLVVCLFLSFWWVLIRGIIQFIFFHWAVHGCNAGSMVGYDYPGGGFTCPPTVTPIAGIQNWNRSLAEGCVATPHNNVVPATTILLETAQDMWGQQFELYHGAPGSNMITSAQKGSWYRTWGPWFWTYTYQDLGHSQTSLYMRPTLVGMMGLYSETRIMRCDGDSVWFFGEGTGWMTNRLRTFFHMQREASFKIYNATGRVGTALETFQGTKSITFRQYPGDDMWGSAVLDSSGSHRHDLWTTNVAPSALSGRGIDDLPPYYVMNAAAVLMGFRWRSIRRANGLTSAGEAAPSPPSFFLAETSGASAGYFEEADDTIQNAGGINDETGTSEVAAPLPTSLEDGEKISNTMADEVVGEKTDA